MAAFRLCTALLVTPIMSASCCAVRSRKRIQRSISVTCHVVMALRVLPVLGAVRAPVVYAGFALPLIAFPRQIPPQYLLLR
jgi:hypothetical protein